MCWRSHSVAALLFFSAAVCNARTNADAASPAFSNVPELVSGFQSLYLQNFTEAREKFSKWETQHQEEPFGEVAVAASYLFEELYRQNVLTSDFFLNEKRFLHGIEGKPNAARMNDFRGALARPRELSRNRLKTSPKDPEALFGLTLAARREKQNVLAQKLLRELSEEFPANPLFAAEYAKAMGRPIPAVISP